MKELVAPFRAERYRTTGRLSRLIAPPYDVISPEGRARLAALDEHNIVHVMLPEAPPGEDKYAAAAARLAGWRQAGVLARDPEPGVYVMAQDFALPTGERRTRTGMFVALAAEGYDPGRVKPHEKTHAGPKADRLALLRATATSLESIFLLAPDAAGALAAALRGVTTQPPVATAELDGVGIRLWAVRGDPSPLPLPASSLYIADGHHRYETASSFARENPVADRVLAFVVSARDAGLSVLPTHRILHGPGRDRAQLLKDWGRWFEITPLAAGADPVERLAVLGRGGDRTACVVAWRGDDDVALTLRAGTPLDEVAELGKSPAVRNLDVARVEALIVQGFLRGGHATASVSYSADAGEALAAVRSGIATAAVLVNPTRVEQVFAVADARDVMPPKSTYFIPKVPSGLVLRPLT